MRSFPDRGIPHLPESGRRVTVPGLIVTILAPAMFLGGLDRLVFEVEPILRAGEDQRCEAFGERAGMPNEVRIVELVLPK